mgnify:CR=1 FL=1
MTKRNMSIIDHETTTNDRKKRALVFGITNDLCFAVGSMLVGFLKHNPNFEGSIVIFHEDLPEDQMKIMESIYPTISFRKFTREHVESKLSKSANRQVIDRLLARYSIFYFAKFELPDLLDEYERVIWLDVDMLVRGPLDIIWEFDEFTWRPNAPAGKLRADFISLFEDEIRSREYNRPNCGLVGICRNARKRGTVTSTKLYYWFNEIQTRGRSPVADEYSFFLLASTTNAKVKELPPSYNCFSTRQGCETANIIHSVGANKFWNSDSLKLAFPDWQLWYNEWIRHGGEAYRGKVAPTGLFATTPNLLIEASMFQGFWEEVYYKIADKLPPGIIPDIQTHRYYWRIYFRSLPWNKLRIEIVNQGRSFLVSLLNEDTATLDVNLKKQIDNYLCNFDGYVRSSNKLGISWGCAVQAEDVPQKILECAGVVRELELANSEGRIA